MGALGKIDEVIMISEEVLKRKNKMRWIPVESFQGDSGSATLRREHKLSLHA